MGKRQHPSEFLNKTFGDLFVLEEAGFRKKLRLVKCRCVCGLVKNYPLAQLKYGSIVSCGCRIRKLTIQRNTKHGLSTCPLYTVWQGMRERCDYPKHMQFRHCGGKGIRVCSAWLNDFFPFYTWAMKNGYKKGLQLDRINVDGNYEPNNCRWATVTQQMRNMSTNRIIEYKGQKKCVAEWAELFGIRPGLIYDRINKLKWDIDKALTTPPKIITNAA